MPQSWRMPAAPEAKPKPSRAPQAAALLGIALAGFAFRSLATWRPAGQGLSPVEGWLFGPSETAPQVVFVLVAGLLLARRRALRAAVRASRGAPLGAAALLAPAALLFFWARHVGAPDLTLASLALLGLGAALLLAGLALARVVALPAVILLLALPLPHVVTNHVVLLLQSWTAELTAWLLRAAGIAAFVEGDVIQLAGSSFEVIETCSGLRGVHILVLLALAWTALFRPPPLHALILVGAAPLFAFLANTARVVTLVLNPDSAIRALHVSQGIAVFVGGVLALYLLDSLLLRLLPHGAAADSAARAAPAAAAQRAGWGSAIALLVLLGLLAAASVAIPPFRVAQEPRPAVELPDEIEGWKARKQPLDSLYLGSIGFSRSANVVYERGAESVFVFVGHDDLELRAFSLLSPKNALPGSGWQLEERAATAVGRRGFPAQAVVARAGAHRILGIYGYQGSRGVLREAFRELLALDRSPLRRRGGIRILRLGTALGSEPDARAEAEARLARLFDLLEPWLLPPPAADAQGDTRG